MKKHLDILLRAFGVAFLLLITITIFSRCMGQQQHYRITPAKLATWSAFGVGGTIWGAREAYHADARIFEKKWGVGKYSFFGGNAWERQYRGNRYQNTDGQPNAHKPEWGNTFRDVWHSSGVASRLFVVGGSFAIGASKQPLRHKILDFAIGSLASSTGAFLSYHYLRD